MQMTKPVAYVSTNHTKVSRVGEILRVVGFIISFMLMLILAYLAADAIAPNPVTIVFCDVNDVMVTCDNSVSVDLDD
jgi:hypothetical protein